MPDNIADSSDIEQGVGILPVHKEETPDNGVGGGVGVTPSTIIWTPRFLLIFASLFVSGLSIASILTQLWLNGLVGAEAIQLVYMAFVLGSSILIAIKVPKGWIRVGGGLTAIWSLLMGLHFALPLVSQLDPHTALVAHLDIATQSAFLGACLCFSVAYTPLRRWDNWFFCLLPVVGIVIVVLTVVLSPSDLPGGSFSESMIATALLYLGVIMWWFRPANWRVQPGVTFFLGAIPLLQILFTGSGYQKNDVAFFMTLVLLVFFLLVNLRLLQGEQRLFKGLY